MTNQHKVYSIQFGDQAFEILCNNEDAYSIAEFLFLDFPVNQKHPATLQYDIISSGPRPMLSLWEGEKRIYFGTSRYELAYLLMNEIIYHCIKNNDSHHALHAGCVYKDDRCILLPGKSGNGKSTLTSWLVKSGFQYLTDELVFLDSNAKILPMTRPISLKVGTDHDSWILSDHHDKIITCATGSMIPHRLFNENFTPKQPKLTDIIYPQFKSDTPSKLQEISPARSSLYLLSSHVNARNLKGHGVSDISSIIKQCRSFTLSYGSFDDLQKIFDDSFDMLL